MHKNIFIEAKQLNDSVKMQWQDQGDLQRIIKIKLNAAQLVLKGINPLEDVHRLFLAQCFAEVASLSGEDVKNHHPLEKKSEYLQVAINQLKAIRHVTADITNKINRLSSEFVIIKDRLSNNSATIFGTVNKKPEPASTVASTQFQCKVTK